MLAPRWPAIPEERSTLAISCASTSYRLFTSDYAESGSTAPAQPNPKVQCNASPAWPTSPTSCRQSRERDRVSTETVRIVDAVLCTDVVAIYLFGSAVAGGLRVARLCPLGYDIEGQTHDDGTRQERAELAPPPEGKGTRRLFDWW